MSANLVGEETLDRITWGLQLATQGRDHEFPRPPEKLQAVEQEKKRALGQAMWEMNDEALGARYGNQGANDDGFRLNGEQYQPGGMPRMNPIQLLKSLHCFLYQCSEGDVPQCELYRDLKAYADKLAHRICGRLPEYEQAEWA